MENSSENDVDSLRRKIKELREIQRSVEEPEEFGLELKKLLEDCTLQFESKVEQILCDASEVSFSSDQDLDEFWKYLKNELSAEEAKNAKIEEEIERLSKEYVEGYSKLVNEIEGLSCPLEIIESLGLEQGRVLNKGNLSSAPAEYNFKIFELGNQLEKSKLNLKSLEDLESTFNRFEAIEQIEDAFSGLKIVEFEGNHIRLSLRTFIPNLENLPHNHTIDVAEPPEQNHELLIELMDGTMELKHVELLAFLSFYWSLRYNVAISGLLYPNLLFGDALQIFPNDVSISEITDAAKSFSATDSRQVYSPVGVLEKRSSLEWFVKSVQDRIVLCTLRRFLVKSANSARHTFDYVDREETIVAHMVGGVDAFIKLPQGWPLISSGLTLMSLKSSSQYSQEISLTLLCKVAEVANSLDTNARQTISGFTDRIEEILVQQMTAVTST
ncbi:putative invertase inhibitor-like [Capsicum annuum]|nr:putative invertase inhibitor-like [Capsicum annuum]